MSMSIPIHPSSFCCIQDNYSFLFLSHHSCASRNPSHWLLTFFVISESSEPYSAILLTIVLQTLLLTFVVIFLFLFHIIECNCLVATLPFSIFCLISSLLPSTKSTLLHFCLPFLSVPLSYTQFY